MGAKKIPMEWSIVETSYRSSAAQRSELPPEVAVQPAALRPTGAARHPSALRIEARLLSGVDIASAADALVRPGPEAQNRKGGPDPAENHCFWLGMPLGEGIVAGDHGGVQLRVRILRSGPEKDLGEERRSREGVQAPSDTLTASGDVEAREGMEIAIVAKPNLDSPVRERLEKHSEATLRPPRSLRDDGANAEILGEQARDDRGLAVRMRPKHDRAGVRLGQGQPVSRRR